MRKIPFHRQKTICCYLLRGFIIHLYLLSSFGHLVAVPAWTVRVRFLHLRVELPTAGEVIDRLKREGGLISREVQRQVHYRKTAWRTAQIQIIQNRNKTHDRYHHEPEREVHVIITVYKCNPDSMEISHFCEKLQKHTYLYINV